MVSALIVMPPLSGSCIQAAAIWQGGPVFVELGNHERPELWNLDLQPFGARRKVLGLFVGSRRLIRARHPIHLAFNRRGRRSHLSGDGP